MQDDSLTALKRYKPLLQQLVLRDLKVKYRRSVLGYLWSLLNPLLMMCVMTLVFSFVFRFDIENYPVYVIIGQTIWNFFFEATNMSMDSILVNSALIKKVYIPKLIFPFSRVSSSFVTMVFSLMAILIVMVFTRVEFTWALLALPFVLVCVYGFALGIGTLLSALVVFFRDMKYLYGVITTAWMYMTPIFWTTDILPSEISFILKLNPLWHYISYFRSIVLDGVIPPLSEHIICLGFTIAAVAIGIYAFRKSERNFILYI